MRPVTNWVTLAGLCGDIAGAFFIARGVLSSRKQYAEEHGVQWIGTNYSRDIAHVNDQVDVGLGTSLLILGFFLQAIGVFTAGTAELDIGFAAVTIFAIAGAFWGRKRLQVRGQRDMFLIRLDHQMSFDNLADYQHRLMVSGFVREEHDTANGPIISLKNALHLDEATYRRLQVIAGEAPN